MTVQTTGAGTIKPNYNGQVLEIGKSYIMTAKAVAKASVFTNWTYGISGTVATNKASITFVMQSNLVLTANFRSLMGLSSMANIAVDMSATPQADIVRELLPPIFRPAEYYVNAARPNDGGNGTSWEKAKKTIQAAVNLTKDGDTVWVTNGTYVLSSEISVTNAITIRSVNGPEVTVVDGNGATRCFNLHDSACLVGGFTIQNGDTRSMVEYEGSYGGPNVYGGPGGGVRCDSSLPVISNCVLTANYASGDWDVPSGGWYYGSSGGGMNNGTAIGCIFRENIARAGAGMAYGIAVSCLFVGNQGEQTGPFGGCGGAGKEDGEAYNCTFVGNNSAVGAGISHVTAYNCVFSGNIGRYPQSDFYEATVYNSCSLDLEHGVDGNITNAPLFVDAANGDFRLQADSPCINAGSNSYVSTATDLDGNPRIVGGVVDMGAYEVSPQTYYVDALRPDDSGAATNWATAKQTIQAAVDPTRDGDTVWVTNGVYNTGSAVTPGGLLSNRVVATNAIVIRSVNGPEVTVIQGQGPIGTNAVRGVYLSGGAQLIGFTVENGATFETDNGNGWGTFGGGIFCFGNSVVSNCVVRNNFAQNNGGGLAAWFNGNLICNSTFESNRTRAGGGGVELRDSGTSVMRNCQIVGNQAALCGGGAIIYHSGTFENCLIADNAATNNAGGVFVDWGTGYSGLGDAYIVNCTIAGNTAPSYGGLDYVINGATVRNSIIQGNTGGEWTGGSYTYCATYPLPAGVGNTTNDPLFADSSYRLGAGSPCIDAGNNSYVSTANDLDGNPRIINGTVDMGVYETPYYALTVTGGTGGGAYANGSRVTIAANVRDGWAFTRWIGATQYVASVTSSATTVTMPAWDINLTATYKKDNARPTLKITSPTADLKVLATNGLFAVQGTTSDNNIATNVLVQLNGGSWINASTTNGWKNWSLPVALIPGRNTIRAYSVDSAMNRSPIKFVECTYVPGAVMQVQANGAGTITPNYNGEVLKVGKHYTMTARAEKKSSVFTGWTYGIVGPVASSKREITFVMQSNLVLTANFNSISETSAKADVAGDAQLIVVPTKVIGLSGSLAFGSVQVGDTSNRTLTVSNSGNTALTVTNISYPVCFSGAWSVVIGAGASTNVAVTFTPVAVTNYSGTVTVNSDATSGTNTISASGTGAVPTVPTITTVSPLPSGSVGTAYTQTLTAVGGIAPYRWSLVSISLPAGLSLSSSGVISGTPEAAGTMNIVVQVAGNGGLYSTKMFRMTIITTPTAPAITTASPLPSGSVGVAYNRILTASGGATPYSWSLCSGRLPAGITLHSIGVVSGMPGEVGTANFTVQVTGSDGLSSTNAFSLTITDIKKPTLKITAPTAKAKILATNGLFTIRGTAADNLALTNVLVQFNGGTWTNAVTTNGWKNWSLPVTLTAGPNTIRAYSVDSAINNSLTSTVVFTYAPMAVIEVQVNGAGTVKPNYNGQVLEIGKSYKMTAKAASFGSAFNNWTYGVGGDIAASKAAITFVMQSNLVLTANFNSISEISAKADIAVDALVNAQAAITVDGSAKDWANVPRSSFSYASVTQEVAVALDGNNIGLLLTGCPFETTDNVLVYFKLRLSYGVGDNRHSVDLWTSGSVLYGMVDGQVIAGLEAVLLNGVLEVKLPVDQAPSQVTIEEVACGMDLGAGTLTELFRISPAVQ